MDMKNGNDMNNTNLTTEEINDRLFQAGMDMAWAVFECPWEYLSPFQKFSIRYTVAVLYIAGWVNRRLSKKS
jgi:hypothetical protein